MELFETARAVHIATGTVVLASFWGAAYATKGSPQHRVIGRVYVIAMAILLSITLVMAAGMVQSGMGMRAVFNVYVTFISVASVWMAWRSIVDKGDVDRYRGWSYKVICAVLGGYAIFLMTVIPKMGSPARMAMVFAFATLGLVTAGAMAWRIVRGADHPRWWLSEHLTAMALNFGATHASFSILALGAIFPALKEPWTRTAILAGWMLAALAVRVWAGRRFLGRADRGKPALAGLSRAES
ncbi:MAG: hypothetical protein AD742_05120 [Methylibium sp. NZG]|nr:MAG: hypothetical protein AD742_05120 [Methylibium sp. NZG]